MLLLIVNQAKLTAKRKEKGLSQHKLSILAGLSSNAVFRMETKPYRVSRLRAKAITDVLECKMDELFHVTV